MTSVDSATASRWDATVLTGEDQRPPDAGGLLVVLLTVQVERVQHIERSAVIGARDEDRRMRVAPVVPCPELPPIGEEVRELGAVDDQLVPVCQLGVEGGTGCRQAGVEFLLGGGAVGRVLGPERGDVLRREAGVRFGGVMPVPPVRATSACLDLLAQAVEVARREPCRVAVPACGGRRGDEAPPALVEQGRHDDSAECVLEVQIGGLVDDHAAE